MSSEARFVGPVDRLLYLRTLPTLQGVSTRELAALAGHARERFHRRGQYLTRRGEPLREFFVLVSGEVSVSQDGEHRLRCVPGDNVGMVTALARAGEGMEARAEADSIVLEFDLETIFDVYEENFTILQTAIRNLAAYHLGLLRRTITGSVRAPWVGTPFKVPDRELDVVEKLVLLRRGNIFRNIGLEALVLMATSMQQERWPAGTRLWEIGQPGSFLLMILEGEVRCRLGDGGDTFTAGPGYPLGNIETLARADRWYVPEATTDLVTMRGNHEALFDVLEDDFDVAMDFMAAMAQGVMATIGRLAERGDEELSPVFVFRSDS